MRTAQQRAKTNHKVVSVGALLMAVLATFLFVLTACGQSKDEKTEAATVADQELTVYSGREAEYVAPLYKRFERATGAKVKVRYGDSGELAQTLIEEGKASPADIFFSQDAGALGALEKEGLLEKLPSSVLNEVDLRFRSKSGNWIGTSGRARIVGYNRDKLSEDDMPQSIDGLTAKRWKDRIGWAPTNSSFQAFVTAMRLQRGDQATLKWLKGIVANDPQAYENNEAIRDAIAKQEVQIGLLNHYYVVEAYEEEGSDYPVGIYYLPGGDPGSLVNVAGVGVLKTAEDNRELALDFVRFLLSRQTQKYFAQKVKEYPLVAPTKPDRRLKPLDEIEQPKIQLGDLDDVKGTNRLLRESGAL